MELSTKFNVNDEVWFLHPQSQKAVCGKVINIKCEVRGQPKYKPVGNRSLVKTGEYTPILRSNEYLMDDSVAQKPVYKSEYEIFETKEQLVNYLKQKVEAL